MAIAYKGFQVWYCDPTTLENLQYCRDFEFCIATRTGSAAREAGTDEQILSSLSAVFPDLASIGGLAVVSADYTTNFLPRLQAILPLAVLLDAVNNTGAPAKIKLQAANGSFAVSSITVANGARISGSSYQGQSYALYDTQGVFLGWTIEMTAVGPAGCLFAYVDNYTGGDLPPLSSSNFGYYCVNYNGDTNLYLEQRRIATGSAEGVAAWLNAIGPLIPPPPPDTDPYAPGGISGPGGGTGTFSDTSTPIDFPPLPNISVEDTGFINLWNPSASQLRLLADYMWDTSLFDLNTWHKLFADPMDAILGLSIVPVTIPNGATQFVVVGNITTTIPMTRAGAQFVEVDCGSLLIEEKWGAYLDYSPYTKAELYLPYCGTHSIDVDNIMGKTVHIKYHVDILSGSCCAYVKCGDSILYSFIGQCSSSIPVNGADFTTMINGVIQAATAVGSMIPSGGMAAPMAAPNLAQMVPNVLKPEIEKSGSMSGTGGMLALQTPYLILTRPNQALPAHQNHYTGYPSFITQTLGDLSGYTEVELIHLEGIPATGDELDELENILKSGVIF